MPADRFLHPRAGHSVKITMLTDLEYRVWTQYLLSSDDFGVMRAQPLGFQNDNDHLANRPAKMLQRCIDSLVKATLVRSFEHQGKPYLYQSDWQRWQKVEYPRATNNPAPPDLSACDEGTKLLFLKHPGGQRKDRRRSEDVPNDSERASQMSPEGVPPTRAGARETAKANANGERLTLTANGQRPEALVPVVVPEFPGDEWWDMLKKTYPPNRVATGDITNKAFIDALIGAKDGPHAAWARMFDNLQNQIQGYEWRVKGMAPNLHKWLTTGAWEQRHEAQPVAALVNDKSARTLTSGDQFVRGRR